MRVLSVYTLVYLAIVTTAQSDGFIGYSLHERGDPNSVIYETANTSPADNISADNPPPAVFLNASVSLGELDIDVQNLTAQIDLSAQVLSLLTFNAGVDVSINQVNLLIQNVTAKVVLEARLENLALMIDSVLNSLDLNPVLATLGQDVGQIVNDTTSALGGTGPGPSSSIIASATASTSASATASAGNSSTTSTANSKTKQARSESYALEHNILYSVNDYSGNTHTNRILAQNGDLVDQFLHNDGHVTGAKVVGFYKRDMHYSGHNLSTTYNAQPAYELEYNYHPFPGLVVVAAMVFDAADKLVATRVLAESRAGGSSTIG